MTTMRRRLSIELDDDLRNEIAAMARRRGVSPNEVTAELIREALDRSEDRALSRLAERRERASRRTVSHGKAW